MSPERIRGYRWLAGLLMALAIAGGAWADAETDARQLDRVFAKSSLRIATPDARLHPFQVWVADDDARRSRGLMYVRELADNAGMLFLYEAQRPVAMWMKNTLISLDMLFVRADGTVARVVENTEPMSLTTIESGEPVVAVIELKAGTAARLKIRAGAKVLHDVFASRE